MKICIDPGHGQYGNPGVTKPYYEGTQMFKLAQLQKAELEKYENTTVTITRKKLADDPSLSARGKMAAGFDLFLSDHSNAPGTGAANYSAITGTTVLDSVTRPNKALATAVGQAVAKSMGHNFRGLTYRKNDSGTDWYGVLRSSIAAGCKSAILIEHGFHTNPKDCGFLLQDANLQKLAKAEVEAIAAHYGLKLKGSGKQPEAPTTGSHQIVGKATATAAQAKTWAKDNGATEVFIGLAELFWRIAMAAGINPVVVYAQSAKETGYGNFRGVLDASFMNPCGLKTSAGGANNDPGAHKRFSSWEEGITAQVDHLALYAGAQGYPKAGTPDPRHFPYLKGTAPTVEQLGGKWAPASTYGTGIVAMMKKLEATKAASAPTTPQAPDPDPAVMYYVQTGAYSKKANADAQYHKVKAAGFAAIIKKSGNLYRVQAGAFGVKANANALELKLKAAGFDTYVTTTGGTQVPAGSAPAPVKKMEVGSKVKIKSSATKYSTGQQIPGWVKAKTYTVQQLGSGKALLKEIVSWVNTSDLTLV